MCVPVKLNKKQPSVPCGHKCSVCRSVSCNEKPIMCLLTGSSEPIKTKYNEEMGLRTSRPPTSAAYETGSNVITQTHTQQERGEKGIQESFPISPESRERKKDFIWVCLKSQASIWPLQLYGTEVKEKKEMRGTEERKIL